MRRRTRRGWGTDPPRPCCDAAVGGSCDSASSRSGGRETRLNGGRRGRTSWSPSGGGYPSTSTRFLRRIADAMTRKGPVEGGDDDDGADNNDFFVDALCDDENDDDDDDDDRRGAAPEEEEEGGKGGRPGTTTTTTGVPEYVLTDEFSREAYDRIMRQYTEARHYARAAGGRTNPVVRRQARQRRRRPFQPERRRC